MGGEPVEDVRRDAAAAGDPGDADDEADRDGVEQDDEEAVEEGFQAALTGVFAALHEEGDRHRDHREHAGRQEHRESPQDCLQDQCPEIIRLLRRVQITINLWDVSRGTTTSGTRIFNRMEIRLEIPIDGHVAGFTLAGHIRDRAGHVVDPGIQLARQDQLIAVRGLFDLGSPLNLRRGKLQQNAEREDEPQHRQAGSAISRWRRNGSRGSR